MCPRSLNTPFIWSEDWTAQFRAYGDPPAQRAAEDLAYNAARFFAKNGTVINHYMFHGGTNFERTGASFVTPRYYDEGPLDEYGLLKEPKFGHLKGLHRIAQLTSKTLLEGDYSVEQLADNIEARVYQMGGSNDNCVAFLSNSDKRRDATVTFRGQQYSLRRLSVSILPDCKTVAFDTSEVAAQHNSRSFIKAKESNEDNVWEMYNERIIKFSEMSIKGAEPMEQFNLSKDTTDYVWYSTRFNVEAADLPRRKDIHPVAQISSSGHAVVAFANGECIGDGHGTRIEMSFALSKPMNLKVGANELTFLSVTIGMPDGGKNMEQRVAGLHTVAIQGLNTGTLDLTPTTWGHEVGLSGEKQQIYSEEGTRKVQWSPAENGRQATWYKRYFTTPHFNEPVVVDMSSMSKGMVWVNGFNIGRYWISYHNPLGNPCQTVYHIPRSLLKERGQNLIVVFEELGGDPTGITFQSVKRDNVCAYVGANYASDVETWMTKEGKKPTADDIKPEAKVSCYAGKRIKSVAFADYGNPIGSCGEFVRGNCSNPLTFQVVKKECVGKSSCRFDVTNPEMYGADPNCPGTKNLLALQVKCSRSKDDSG